MSAPDFANDFDRTRWAFARLLEAARARAAAETEIAAAFEAAREAAERLLARTRAAVEAERAAELGQLDAAHQEALAAHTRRFDAERYTLDRGHEERKHELTRRYTAAADRARAEYQDRLWQIDSLLEAGEKAAQDRLTTLRRATEASEAQVTATWAAVEPLLNRVGLSRADVELLGPSPGVPSEPADGDPLVRMNDALRQGSEISARLVRLRTPAWGRPAGRLGLSGLAATLGALSFLWLDPETAVAITLAMAAAGGLLAGEAVRWLARRQIERLGRELARQLAVAAHAARQVHDQAAREYAEEHARLTDRHARQRREADDYYRPRLENQKRLYETESARLEAAYTEQLERLTQQRAVEEQAERAAYQARRAEVVARLEARLREAEEACAEKLAAAAAARDVAWERLAAAWRQAVSDVDRTCAHLRAVGTRWFPDWETLARSDCPRPDRVPAGVRCGEWLLDWSLIPDGLPTDPRLAPPFTLAGPVPALIPFPDRCSVLLRARDEGRAAAVALLQALMLRFLTALPPGRVRFTVIDPVGLGENFAAFMHLADYDEAFVTSRIWTEPAHIEQRLTDLTDHIAGVIQKYLRNQYRTIEEYNRAAGEVAEPYRVLVVANFPVNFTPEAAKRLMSIASSGPSCGVCTLVSADTRLAMPRDFNLADLEAVSFTLAWKDGRFHPKDPVLAQFPLTVDTPPPTELLCRIIHHVGQASRDADRVEVPFDFIAPRPEEVWMGSTASGFEVPVGRAGATRRQLFRLGQGTAQHALVAGKTGSGKSTLLHVLITNLALTYSPDEAQLYLIDFKEGVEFQWYATHRLPHARVVAIQSEREFGLSVLQRLDTILRERGERFRDAGVNDLAGYRAARPHEPMPRILLVIDEFQQLFVEDDKLAQEAALILDRLVRQGRAFGIHVVLGSQTLGGSYSLPRSTMDQMAVRVALQCTEADAQLILGKDNTAARLLSRPGEAIYNDQGGAVEGNDPFQVVWLSEEKREQILRDLRQRAGDRWPPPLVFAGHAPADLTANPHLARWLTRPQAAAIPTAWLGEPVAIEEPTAAVFRPLGGTNLLVVGADEGVARGLVVAALLALAAQAGGGDGPALTVLDGTPDDAVTADSLRHLVAGLPGVCIPDRSALSAALADLHAEVDRRSRGDSADRTPRFLFVFGLHRLRELRKAEDDFGFGRRDPDREPTPAERFAALLRDGPPVGIHTLLWCDSLTNLTRALDRPLLREFAQRVLLQMSAADSSTLIDTPAASRLGRYRALFVTEERDRPQKFRPYGLPPTEWLERTCEGLRARLGLRPRPAGV